MKYFDFKDKKISRLGFGSMRLPMDDEGKIDFEHGKKMIDYALANGITYFDTAYMYHAGRAEVFIKNALVERHPRESFFLADKMPTWLASSKEDVDKIFNKQLSKCGVDYFDFYLIHSIEEDQWEKIKEYEVAEYLKEKLDAGIIKHLGASVHCGAPLLEEILQTYGDILEFIQIQLNYMDWEFKDAKALYDVCIKYNKPIIIMEPVRGGMLADPKSEEARKILDEAAGGSLQYVDYALGFVDSLPGVMCTLSGMSSIEQLEHNIDFFNGPSLNKAQLEAIEKASYELKSDILIPCTGCNYCFDCPSEIKISSIFAAYNEAAAKGFNYIWGKLSSIYDELGNNATNCIQCGACEGCCPQKIDIINQLKLVDQKYQELKEAGK